MIDRSLGRLSLNTSVTERYLQQRDDDEDDGHGVKVSRQPVLQRRDAAFGVDVIAPVSLYEENVGEH